MSERTAVLPATTSTFTQPDNPCYQISERRANNYEVRFDMGAYKHLYSQKNTLPPEEFQRQLEILDALTKHNLLTALMERVSVQISQIGFQFVDGKLKSAQFDEPMEDVLKRGQQYRLRNGNEIDHPREAAEVIGFLKRQEALKNGARVNVSISKRGAKGSDYPHHFFDVDENFEDEVAVMSRYTLKIPDEELVKAAKAIDPNYPDPEPNEPLDAFLLRNPLIDVSLKKVMSVLHQDESAMPLSEFGVKVELPTRAMRDYYVERAKNGANELELSSIRKTILKLTDLGIGKDTFTPDNIKAFEEAQLMLNTQGPKAVTAHFSTQQIRSVPTNCGLQETGSSVYTVGEFGIMRDGSGTQQIICKTCGFEYMRNAGILEPRCRLCSGTDGIAC